MSKINYKFLSNLKYYDYNNTFNTQLFFNDALEIINNKSNNIIQTFYNILTKLYINKNNSTENHYLNTFSLNKLDSLKIIILINLIQFNKVNNNHYIMLLSDLLFIKIMYNLFNNKIDNYAFNIENNTQNTILQINNFIKNELHNDNFIYNTKLIYKFINQFNKNDSIEYIDKLHFFIYYVFLQLFDNKIYDNIENYDYLNMKYLDFFINNKFYFIKRLYPFNFSIDYSNDITDKELLKDIHNKFNFNKSIDDIIKSQKSINIRQLRFINKHFNTSINLNEELDDNFIYITKNKSKTTNIIKAEKNIMYNFDIKNKIFYDSNDLIVFNNCYFVSSIQLLLTILNIENKKINDDKLNKFINILTHSNKNKFVLTQIYNFLCDYGYEKYIKFTGINNFMREPAIYINILLSILYKIDSNIFKICGLKTKDKKRMFIYNINNYYKNKYNEDFYDDITKKIDYSYYGGKKNKDESINTNNKDESINTINDYIYYQNYNKKDILVIDDIINTPDYIIVNYKTLINDLLSNKNKNDITDKELNKLFLNTVSFYNDNNIEVNDNFITSKYYKYLKIKNTIYKIHSFITYNNNHYKYNLSFDYLNSSNKIYYIIIAVYIKLDDKLKIEYENINSYTKYFRNDLDELNIIDKYNVINDFIENKKLNLQFFNNKNSQKYIKYINCLSKNIDKYKNINYSDLLKININVNIDDDINDEIDKIIKLNKRINYNTFKLMFEYLLNNPDYINKIYHLYYLGSNVNYEYFKQNKLIMNGGNNDIKNDMYKYVYNKLKEKIK